MRLETDKVLVYLSLGSNVNAEENIKSALVGLKDHYGELSISPIYESESVGFDGDNFLNLVVGLTSDQNFDVFVKGLKDLETKLGRERPGAKFGPRTIDIDILTFGDFVGDSSKVKIPRGEITENAYVLLPLKDLVPTAVHPSLNTTYEELWVERSEKMKAQVLWRSDFQFIDG